MMEPQRSTGGQKEHRVGQLLRRRPRHQGARQLAIGCRPPRIHPKAFVALEFRNDGSQAVLAWVVDPIYVGKKLGAGGFEMEVVLKQLLPEFTQQEEFIDLFLREAKLALLELNR